MLETLRGLTRLAALAKGLREVEGKPTLEFYLTVLRLRSLGKLL